MGEAFCLMPCSDLLSVGLGITFSSMGQFQMDLGAFSPCQVAYLSGLEFFEQGKYQEAPDSFFESIIFFRSLRPLQGAANSIAARNNTCP